MSSIDVNNSLLLGIFLPGPTFDYNKNFVAPAILENNYERCQALGIPDDVIPERFLCDIQKRIMDEPVKDPNHPQARYEDSVMRAWLARSRTNPFTRQYLSPNSLQKDHALKQDIEAWLDGYQRRPRLS